VQRPAEQLCPAVQAVPQAPQFMASVCVFTHAVPQSIWPAAQAQRPAVQVCPVRQTVPHAPQLLLSVCVLMQALPHAV
jgi:hypothetical protein